jgi:hypothetical protein
MPIAVLIWFLIAVVVGFSGILLSVPLPLPMLGALITIILLVVIAVRRDLRDRALAGGVTPLIAVHLTRFVGFYFLWLYSRGLLPRDFAVPAGWGDVLIASTAIVVLLIVRAQPARRGTRFAVLIWNVAGLIDILMVVAIAMRLTRADPGVQRGFATLPLSVLPTFLVPLVIVTHVLIFVWVARTAPPAR